MARRVAEKPLNLVMVVLDTLRADHLGLYGYERPTSPHLDALARESFVFERAESAAPWTAPSLISLVTSLYPEVHGVRGFPNPRRMSDDVVTLAEVLKRHGYSTAAFTEGGYAKGDFGLDQGFDSYLAEPGRRRVPRLPSALPESPRGESRTQPELAPGAPGGALLPLLPDLRAPRTVSRAGGVHSSLPTALRRAKGARAGGPGHRTLEPSPPGRSRRFAAGAPAHPSLQARRSASAPRQTGLRAGEPRPRPGSAGGVSRKTLPEAGCETYTTRRSPIPTSR